MSRRGSTMRSVSAALAESPEGAKALEAARVPMPDAGRHWSSVHVGSGASLTAVALWHGPRLHSWQVVDAEHGRELGKAMALMRRMPALMVVEPVRPGPDRRRDVADALRVGRAIGALEVFGGEVHELPVDAWRALVVRARLAQVHASSAMTPSAMQRVGLAAVEALTVKAVGGLEQLPPAVGLAGAGADEMRGDGIRLAVRASVGIGLAWMVWQGWA